MAKKTSKVTKKVSKKAKSVSRGEPKRSEKEIAKGILSESMVKTQKRIASLNNQLKQIEAQKQQILILIERETGALTEVSNVLSQFNQKA